MVTLTLLRPFRRQLTPLYWVIQARPSELALVSLRMNSNPWLAPYSANGPRPCARGLLYCVTSWTSAGSLGAEAVENRDNFTTFRPRRGRPPLLSVSITSGCAHSPPANGEDTRSSLTELRIPRLTSQRRVRVDSYQSLCMRP